MSRRAVLAAISALAASLLFVALALLVQGDDRLLRFDLPLARAVQRVTLPGYGWLLTHVSDLGDQPLSTASYLAVATTLIAARQWRAALLGSGSALLAVRVAGLLRQIIARPRPSADLVHVAHTISGPGFPSGHVTMYVTLFGFALYLTLIARRGGWWRVPTSVALTLPLALIGLSRIYLGAHWPSDTLAAYLFGGLWLAATIWLYQQWAQWASRQ